MLETRDQEMARECGGPSKSSASWEEFLLSHPRAWNGPLLQLVQADETKLVACVSDYRAYVESRADVDSHGKIFLAVTGVLFNDSGFLIGRRSENEDQPGTWEFAPAGALEAFPVENQLVRESQEELNINHLKLDVGAPVGLYVNYNTRTADVVVPARVLVPWSEVWGNFEPGEYTEVCTVAYDSLAEFVQDQEVTDGLFRRIVRWIQDGVISTGSDFLRPQ